MDLAAHNLETLFEGSDTNRDGRLNYQEISDLFQRLTGWCGMKNLHACYSATGVRPSSSELQSFMTSVDANSDGHLSLEEFKTWFSTQLQVVILPS